MEDEPGTASILQTIFGRLSGGFLWLAGDKYMAGWALVRERSDEYISARRLNGARLLKKVRRPLFLLLVGSMPASGYHYSF